MFVIRRTDQPGFVAPDRSGQSYVKRAEDARHFRTADEATRNACRGNEVVSRCPHCSGNVPR